MPQLKDIFCKIPVTMFNKIKLKVVSFVSILIEELYMYRYTYSHVLITAHHAMGDLNYEQS